MPSFIATIRRLQRRDSLGDPVWRRKAGTGLKKSYGVKEISAVRKSIEKNPFMTSYQIKLSKKETLKNISPRTIRRILLEDLGRRAVVAKKKPYLSVVHKRERLEWCRNNLKKSNKFWTNQVLWIDEVRFETKAETGGRLVRRPVGASRSDPLFTRKVWRRPQSVMALCGVTGNNDTFIDFIKPGQTIDSKKYCDMVREGLLKSVKGKGLTIVQDNSKVHTSKFSRGVMQQEKINVLFVPPTSPDLNVIENLFGYLKMSLEEKPTVNLAELQLEVRRALKNLPSDYLQKLTGSMRRRIKGVIDVQGEMTDY